MKGLVRLTYDKIIDATSVKAWDKVVFDETYQEFFMQAQRYDQSGQYPTLAALLANVPRANELHYLTSRAAMGYLKQLNQVIPDVVNALGKPCLPFTQFTFEVLASDVTQKATHRISIRFHSDPLTWIDTVGTQLLVAYGDQRPALLAGNEVPTDLIAMQPYLSISTFQP